MSGFNIPDDCSQAMLNAAWASLDDPSDYSESFPFQFLCLVHKYAWSIDEDGIDHGCPQCIEDENS